MNRKDRGVLVPAGSTVDEAGAQSPASSRFT